MADGRARARIREALIGALALIAIGCHAPSAVRRAETLLARGDALAARQVLIEDGDTAALIALAELESRLFPHHRAQGIAALADDDPIGAEESFAQALAIVPDHPEVTSLFARARVLAARRR